MAFLVMATDIMPSEPMPDGSLVLKLGFSRRDWADLTNTTVETICRTLADLAKTGLVRSVSPGRYLIRDLAELSALAGTDPDLDRWIINHGRIPLPDRGASMLDNGGDTAGRGEQIMITTPAPASRGPLAPPNPQGPGSWAQAPQDPPPVDGHQ